MKKQIATLVLALVTGAVMGQQTQQVNSSSTTTTTESSTEISGKRTYIGANGGYLLKNNSTHNDPMYYISNGRFAELNFGTKNNLFGWGSSLGYMELKRDPHQYDKVPINSQMMYDSITNGTQPTTVNSGLENNSLYFDTTMHTRSVYKDFKGFYFMTGPDLWFDFGKLSANIGVEAGVGYSQPGYYFVEGMAKQPKGELMINAPSPTGTNTDYYIFPMSVQYHQFGMSQKYFDKLTGSSKTNPLDENQDREFHFMARATLNLEYFVTPKISVHGGLNYWYIKPPKMVGQQFVQFESIAYSDDPAFGNGNIDYRHGSQYTLPYKANDIKLFSANAGLKFWFGGSKKTTKTVNTVVTNDNTTIEKAAEPIKETPKAAPKSVMVTVIDHLTRTPMGNVAITLQGTDRLPDIHAVTQSNGTIKLDNVAPGAYKVDGMIYNIPTTSGAIQQSQFLNDEPTIYTTLEYNDPRFILKGVAVNTQTGDQETGVKVSLDKGAANVSNSVTKEDGNFSFLLQSNSDYQVQGLKNGLYSNTENVSTNGLNRSQTLYVTLKIGMDKVEVGKSFVVNNILYDLNSATIRPDAGTELQRLANFLKESPDVRIELSSHTDSRGSDAYNMTLSQKRAQSAVDYLVGLGINKNRMVAKGYGETKLVNGCANGIPCTDAEHQANRRTEIQIIQ